MKVAYLLCFVATLSFCAPRTCTSAEAAAISCNGAQYSCFIDAEEYQDGSSKNIPHCIRKYDRTWTVDTSSFASGLAQDHYHVHVSSRSDYVSPGVPGIAHDLFTASDDKAPGLKQRVIKGKLNTRVNGDMPLLGLLLWSQ